MSRRCICVTAMVAALSCAAVHASGSFQIVIQPESALAGNAAALGAFQRAAATWQSYISDPVTIYINADVSSFGAGQENIIGGASSYILVDSYDSMREMMISDATGSHDGIVSSLPSSTVGFRSLPGISYSGGVALTKANAKALGYSTALLDSLVHDSTDAFIQFNSDFAFDYDRSDGISAGTIDFESVALHEIGHALGFISQVDQADRVNGYADSVPYITVDGVNYPVAELDLTTLDLFRFAAGEQPGTAADFANGLREITPGAEAGIYDGVSFYLLSTGVALGDGRQGSHWKDNELTGTIVGALDPTIGYGQIFELSEADLRALDLIGYDVIASVPEPSVLLGCSGVLVLMLRRRRA